MKTNFKKLVLAAGLVCGVSTSAISANNPLYIVKTRTKSVIQAEHYWEFNKDDNPNHYGWCGNTALRSAMTAFGVYKTPDEIHNTLLRINANSGNRYNYTPNPGTCSGYGYCPELNLLKEGATAFGLRTARYDAYSEDQLFNSIKSIIDSGGVAVVLSRTYAYGPNPDTGWGNVGHFYTVHGYRVQNSVRYLYMRDPVFKVGGGATDIREIPMGTWWNQMKIYSPERGNQYYVGYFSVNK